MLRPHATVDKAMATNMEVKECLMIQLEPRREKPWDGPLLGAVGELS
jgi:hypothetical protein